MGKRIFRKEPTEGRRIFTGSKRPKADTAPPPRAKTGEVKGSSEDSSSSNQKK